MSCVLVCPFEDEGPRFGREGISPGKASMEFRHGNGIGGSGSNSYVLYTICARSQHVGNIGLAGSTPEANREKNLEERNSSGNRSRYDTPGT